MALLRFERLYLLLSLVLYSLSSSASNALGKETPIRAVNLGGWLVLEPWITPSIFEQAGPQAVDEFTLCQALGSNAQDRLRAHWSSWITESDFAEIANAGLNHVRIPVGYWAVNPIPGEPYVQGQLEFLDKALQWAREHKLQVIIDLHGAPGSQNGFDNSGRRGPILWQTGDNVKKTVEVIRSLAKTYAPQTDVVRAIELINEPFPPAIDVAKLKQYYYDGWGTIRDYDQNTGVVISDAFQDITSWNGFMTDGFNNVYLDTHHYEIFDDNLVKYSVDQHVSMACQFGRDKVSKGDKWTIVGEWTGAMTDCAKYLNGRGKGARFDGTYSSDLPGPKCNGKSSGFPQNFSPEDRDNTRRFIEAQLDSFEMGRGWAFWTWKTEGAPEWDMQKLIEANIFPKPVDTRQYPGQCG